MKRIYLAGAIEWQDNAYTTEWRQEAGRLSRARGLDVIDPTYFDGASDGLTASEVVIRDRYLLRQADAILADGRKPGWGTAMEILDAYQLGMLVVVWGAERKSLFLVHHTARFTDTVADGVQYIADMLQLME